MDIGIDPKLAFFHSLNTYFDQIYVLSIPRLQHRQEYIKELLIGLEFEFVMGCDKEDLVKSDYLQFVNTTAYQKLSRNAKGLKAGEVACAMTHMKAYQLAVDNKYRRVLLLEDDIILNLDTIDQLDEVLKDLPDSWEMVYFGYWKNEARTLLSLFKQGFYAMLSILGLHKWTITRILNTYPKPYSRHLQRAGNHEGAHAYAITLGACKKMLEFNSPIVLNADHALTHIVTNHVIEGYISKKKFFDQHSQLHHKGFQSETI